jgi:DNA-binding transcriptional ArsR family regulator
VPDDVFQVTTPAHFKALAHPLRQRLVFALAEPATISQLAVALDTNKGNVAHHLRVLREAGLVQPAGSRQVRGGTEQYYQRAAASFEISDQNHGQSLPAAFRAIADEIVAAEPDPFLVLRHLRLSPAQAEQIRQTLTAIAHDSADAGPGQPRYGLLLGFYRPPETPH